MITRKARRALVALIAATSVAIGAAACTTSDQHDDHSIDGTTGTVFPTDQIAPLVQAVPQKTVKELATPRLADGLVPPTNRWFSGLVFGDQPQPVFPLPLSFGLTAQGFSFGQPTVSASAKNIAGGFKPDVAVTTGAASSKVSAYDDLTVSIDSLDAGGKTLGHTTIAQGSPFVSYTTEQAATITTGIGFTAHGDYAIAQAGDVTYGVKLSGGSVNGTSVQLPKGATATFFVVPTDGDADKLAELAGHPVTGGSASYQLSGGKATTTLRYQSDGGATAFAAMPHQSTNLAGGTSCDLGTYPSIYGTLKLCSGEQLSWTAPVTDPTSDLPVDKLSAADRKELAAQTVKDINATKEFPADTYFGGKALYRAAMLYQLADQLGEKDAAAAMKAKLTAQLDLWTDPQGCAKRAERCFVYDEKNHGVVGLAASFGSDEFNDHHFHYGYFLYAAGVLGQHDPTLVSKYAPVMNLLAADLGSSASNGSFPNRRVFDVYAGHSWASGTSPFADGNNQESSSEAITAWTGLALWAQVSKNDALRTEAVWMLSLEAQAGLAYWTNFDTSEPVYSGYGHKIVSLNWGGKRDYATWFSPEPAAMLGILVIPMSPASGYLGGDPDRIRANVAEATGGKFDQKFGDYLLMYSGLAGRSDADQALAKARTLDSKWIDDGNSRAYMLAWLMTQDR